MSKFEEIKNGCSCKYSSPIPTRSVCDMHKKNRDDIDATEKQIRLLKLKLKYYRAIDNVTNEHSLKKEFKFKIAEENLNR